MSAPLAERLKVIVGDITKLAVDAIVTAVHEMGLALDEPMPAISALLGLTRVLARRRGLYPAASASETTVARNSHPSGG